MENNQTRSTNRVGWNKAQQEALNFILAMAVTVLLYKGVYNHFIF